MRWISQSDISQMLIHSASLSSQYICRKSSDVSLKWRTVYKVAIGNVIISSFNRKQIRVLHGNGDDIHTAGVRTTEMVNINAHFAVSRVGGDNREMTRLTSIPLDASFIRLSKVKRRVMTLIYSIIISSGGGEGEFH